MIINDTNSPSNGGVFAHNGNETINDSKVDDAPKHRQGRPASAGPGAIGAFSGDVVKNPGSTQDRVEKTLCVMSVAADGRGGWRFMAQLPGVDGDVGMVPVLDLDPVSGPAFYSYGERIIIGNGPLTVDGYHYIAHFDHPDGVVWMGLQKDGNLVTYQNEIQWERSTKQPLWATSWAGGNLVDPSKTVMRPRPTPAPSPIPTPHPLPPIPVPDPNEGYSEFVYKGIRYTVKIGDFPTMEGIFKVKLDRSDMEAYESGAMTWTQVIEKFFKKVEGDNESPTA